MVSHVDDDHIKGILDLTKEQRAKNPDVRLEVTSLWHNSFDDLLKTRPDELVRGRLTASLERRRRRRSRGFRFRVCAGRPR